MCQPLICFQFMNRLELRADDYLEPQGPFCLAGIGLGSNLCGDRSQAILATPAVSLAQRTKFSSYPEYNRDSSSSSFYPKASYLMPF